MCRLAFGSILRRKGEWGLGACASDIGALLCGTLLLLATAGCSVLPRLAAQLRECSASCLLHTHLPPFLHAQCLHYTRLEPPGGEQDGLVESTITVKEAFPLASVAVKNIQLVHSRVGALKVSCADAACPALGRCRSWSTKRNLERLPDRPLLPLSTCSCRWSPRPAMSQAPSCRRARR